MRFFAPILGLLVILAGCKGSRESEVIGTWKTQTGSMVTVSSDKSFEIVTGRVSSKGNWSISGDDVTFKSTSTLGKPIDQVKAMITRNLPRLNPQKRVLMEKYLLDIEKPNVELLSSDGKSMTVDKAKDTNTDPWSTLTKL